MRRKKVEHLSEKHQKLIKGLNVLKGNINMTNEMLDETKTRQALKENEILIEMLKTLKAN